MSSRLAIEYSLINKLLSMARIEQSILSILFSFVPRRIIPQNKKMGESFKSPEQPFGGPVKFCPGAAVVSACMPRPRQGRREPMALLFPTQLHRRAIENAQVISLFPDSHAKSCPSIILHSNSSVFILHQEVVVV
jgi:hypothetical protein